MSQQVLSTNTFTSATWIVNSNATKGTHTTLAGALTAASSGDTILLQSSVTENPTLKAGVNIVALLGSELTPNITITGKCTFTTAGTVTMSGIRFTTNSDFAIAVTGSAASILNLDNCYLNCSNNTGISYSSSSGSSAVNLYRSNGNLGTTGIGYYTATGAGAIYFEGGSYINTGASTTASTTSACPVTLSYVQIEAALSSTSTGAYFILNSFLEPAAAGINVAALTTAGTGVHLVIQSSFSSGSASALSVGAGTTVTFEGVCNVRSTNTNAVTGSGTFGGATTYTGSSSMNNVTTKTAYNMEVGGLSFDYGTNMMSAYATGTFTPTIFGGSTAGTTTYSVQNGYYVKVGKLVWITASVTWTAQTGTGSINVGNLPFTVANIQTNACSVASGVSIATSTQYNVVAPSGGTTMTLYGWISASGTLVQSNIATNASSNVSITIIYQSTT